MKTSILILFMLFTIILFSGEISGTLNFTNEQLSLENINEFIKPKVDGCSYSYSKDLLGTPELPVKILTFLIPPTAAIDNVIVEVIDKTSLGTGFNIHPIQRAEPFMMHNRNEHFDFIPMNKEILQLKSNYPIIAGKAGHMGNKNGWQLFTITIYPISYNIGNGEIFLNTNINYSITFTENTKSISMINSRIKNKSIEYIKDIVENPEMAEKWAPQSFKASADSIDYVIIAPSIWASAVEPLREWKTLKGQRAITITTEWIYANYSGIDQSEQVRNFIIDVYNDWGAMYFLLVGQDDSDIDDSGYSESPGSWAPRRDTYCMSSGAGYYSDEDTIAADLYYCDLDGNWNADADGTWGELSDNVDLYTDVYVGRILSETEAEVIGYINRAIDHEKNYPMGMANKQILTSENLFPGYDGAQVSDSVAFYAPSNFVNAKCYDETDNYDDIATLDSMEVGYGYVHHAGHGLEYGLMSVDLITNTDIETSLDISTNLYGIVTAISCLSGAFDYDCYAEHLQVDCATNVGGVSAVILSYRYGWGLISALGRSETLDIWFMQSIAATGDFSVNTTRIGEALAAAKDKAVPYTASDNIARWCIYEYNLFGDPELALWTEDPNDFAASYPSQVGTGNLIIDITVTDNITSTPIENAYICLMSLTAAGDTMVYNRGYTNAAGIASITVNPTENGTINITITKQNYDPYEGTISILSGAPQKPQTSKLFNYARIPDLRPLLSFSSIDDENDDIRYRVLWDTDQSFGSPDSATTAVYSSGEQVNFTFPSDLSGNTTYFWKLKANDPSGSGYWSSYSTINSFAVFLNLGTDNCSWYQTISEQFNFCTLNNLRIIGDSILLNSSYSGADTLIDAYFESGIPSSGWTTTSGSSSAVWGTGTGASNAPPSFGTSYARIVYPSSGPAPSADTDILTSKKYSLTAGTNVLSFEYGWGMDAATTDEMTCEVIFYNGGWGSWTQIASYTVDGSGTEMIDLSSYLPADSVQVRWSYITPGGRNGQDGAIDNVMLIGEYDVVSDYGSLTTPSIIYADLNNAYPRSVWGYINWKKQTSADSLLVQVEYYESGSWNLIPNVDLSGNSTGISGNDIGNGITNLDISALNVSTYDTIRGIYNIYRKSSKSAIEPVLTAIEIGNPAANILNVEQVNISANCINNIVYLEWNNNSNANYWILEKGLGNNFKVITEIRDNNSNRIQYKDTDILPQREYSYRIISVNENGEKILFGSINIRTGNFSNVFTFNVLPFVNNNDLSISYNVPFADNIEINVFDLSGRMIRCLVNKKHDAGLYRINWNTKNSINPIPAGTYFIMMKASNFSDIRKTIILK